MMNRIDLRLRLLLASFFICISSQGIAQEKKVASESFSGDTLAFNYKGNFKNATISVAGPNGFRISSFQENGNPIVNLSNTTESDSADGELTNNFNEAISLSDGIYKYEITVATDETVEITDNMNNGRGENARTTMNISEVQSGHFHVKDGSIVTYLDLKEGE